MAKKKLTGENYFSPEMDMRYVGSTQFKSFMECEHSAYAKLTGALTETKTEALLMGSYFDAMFDGSLASFKLNTPEIMNSKKPTEVLAKYTLVDRIYERVSRDAYFMETMSGKSQQIFTGEIEGVPVKIKVDSMHPDRIVDLKLMKDFKDIWNESTRRYEPWQVARGYNIQAAIYREIVRQNTGDTLPFFIAAATKETETGTGDLKTDFGVFKFLDADLDSALEYVKQNIVHVNEVKQGIVVPRRCNDCKYCRETKVLTGYSLFDAPDI